MLRQPALYFLIFIVFVSIISISTSTAPEVVNKTAPDSVFSAERAHVFLKEIAKAPHSLGTIEHTKVREYIVSVCNQLGLETEIQTTTAIQSFDRGVIAANVNNVIATLKGTTGGKVVVIMAHYDSQPNALGAGDDGAAVAAMLETARILKAGKPLVNDVIFLFTDGEEDGLLGAKAFVQESPLLNKIGLVINFEGRGNSGVSTMFEVNPKNGWAVNEYIKAAKHPVANSLSFEVYKNLPNDTDYTVFKKAGITGLNNAFVDGFVNYHSMTDGAENMDLKSLQNHGDNMLSLAKHFGNLDLTNTKADDVSYFNILGLGIIHYPAALDIFFLIITILLFIVFVVMGIRKQQITIKGLIVGFLIFIGLLVLLIFSSYYLIKGIKSIYPEYQQFYENNSYNVNYYFLALVGLTFAVFGLIYQWSLRKFSIYSLVSGVIIVEFIFIGLMYSEMKTAVYFLCFPVLFQLVGCLISMLRSTKEGDVQSSVILTLFSLPAVLMLAPTIYFLFIVFGLGGTAPAGALVLGLLLGLILPLFSPILKSNRYAVSGISLGILVIALVLAHFHSGYTNKEPLQTNVWYSLDADTQKANWISGFSTPDFWNKQFFPEMKKDTVRGRTGLRLINDAPLIALSPPEIVIKKDTVENSVRKLKLQLKSTREAISMTMITAGKCPITKMIINQMEKQLLSTGHYHYLNFVGLNEKGVTLEIETTPDSPFEFTLVDRSMGLPAVEGIKDYATNVIPGPGSNSNTTQVRKSFSINIK
ncbi:MAG TPA: M20/M25/M40 family metallo-hydrolase [Cyclobacteriaceae bacterium]